MEWEFRNRYDNDAIIANDCTSNANYFIGRRNCDFKYLNTNHNVLIEIFIASCEMGPFD